MIFAQLFWAYLQIGLFGFGGGYAMLSLIHAQVVVQHGWLTAGEFSDIVAISQMTPGPIAINSATYVGYTVAGGGAWGVLGAVVATVAVCLPSFILMVLAAKFIAHLLRNRFVAGAMVGLRPVVVGMIAAAALLLVFPARRATFTSLTEWAIFGAVLVLSTRKVSPILLICLSAVVGIIAC